MSSPRSKSSTRFRGGSTAEPSWTELVVAIDVTCPIFKSGCGYCWTYAKAWGMTEPELCDCCWNKHDEVRVCPSCRRHCLDPNLWDFKHHRCLACVKGDNHGNVRHAV